MPVTITLKNIPDDLHHRLKEAARAHHRSLNGEAIACLERVLLPGRMSPDAQLARVRRLRDELAPGDFDARDIANAIEQGRP